LGGKVFGWDEVDEMLLSSFLLYICVEPRPAVLLKSCQTYLLQNLVHDGVGFFKIGRE